MADIPEKLEHNARLLQTLAYPMKGQDPRLTSPPVVSKLELSYPSPGDLTRILDRATFRLEFTNGLVMEGPLGGVLLTNPRTE